jgi:hypothetical protein
MASKHDLQDWVVQAPKELGGSAYLVDIAKQIWSTNPSDLQTSGDLYTWH